VAADQPERRSATLGEWKLPSTWCPKEERLSSDLDLNSTYGRAHLVPSELLTLEVFQKIADKWTLMVVSTLGTETMRFTTLRDHVGVISHRMLSMTLRGLESDGLVKRVAYPTVPPRVEYSLTELGLGLRAVADTFCTWSHEHAEDIQAARAEFNERQLALREAEEQIAN
jgi:DNA-binding HxlR family transcriptional regulator